MDIIIRKAKISDGSEINKCLKLAFKQYEKEACENAAKGALNEDVSKTVEDIEKQIFLVAEYNGKIVGSVRVKVEEKDGYLSRFSVLPEYHKFGIGKLLLDNIDVIAKKTGLNSIYLHTCFDVSHLVDFYTSCGFVLEDISSDRGYKRAKFRKIYGE